MILRRVAAFRIVSRRRWARIHTYAHAGLEFRMKTVVIAIGGNSLIRTLSR